MELNPGTTVGAIAAERPATIRVFQAHGIDFCCGGSRTLADVSGAHGVAIDTLMADLAGAVSETGAPVPVLVGAPIGDVVRHVLSRYHTWLWRELPRLGGMADKVLNAHGKRHPESVPGMHRLFTTLRAELEPHLIEEEDGIFPALLALEVRTISGRPAERATAPGPVEAGIASLERQHEQVGGLLRDLRATTSGFVPPDDACNTFRGLLYGLSELEREVHEHVHLENNVLFPAAAKLLAG